jgi:hypothetical protein
MNAEDEEESTCGTRICLDARWITGLRIASPGAPTLKRSFDIMHNGANLGPNKMNNW